MLHLHVVLCQWNCLSCCFPRILHSCFSFCVCRFRKPAIYPDPNKLPRYSWGMHKETCDWGCAAAVYCSWWQMLKNEIGMKLVCLYCEEKRSMDAIVGIVYVMSLWQGWRSVWCGLVWLQSAYCEGCPFKQGWLTMLCLRSIVAHRKRLL